MAALAIGLVLLTGIDRKGVALPPPEHLGGLEAIQKTAPQHPDGSVRFQRCTVRVFVDVKGVPYHADAKGCLDDFARAAERALLKWRFRPVAVDGVAVPAAGTVTVVFRLDQDVGTDPPPPPQCTWWLTVTDTGSVSVAQPTSAASCAGWFPEQVRPTVPLEGLSGKCVVTYAKGDGRERPADKTGCPAQLQPVANDLLQRSLIGKISLATVHIDLPPATMPGQTEAPPP